VRAHYAGSERDRDWPILNLTWDYPEHGAHADPDGADVLREMNGFDVATGDPVPAFTALKNDGSTAAGCWIYSGVFKDGVNQARRREPGDLTAPGGWVSPEWGWAWPLNRRILYNRASADPEGRPWSERKRYIWWDDDASKWQTTGDNPDTDDVKSPSYRPPEDARDEQAIAGDKPFGLQADGTGWLYVPMGLEDGPFPTHYEPHESPAGNPLYEQRANPRRQQFKPEDFNGANPYAPADGEPGADAYPFPLTTYRLTEHHTAGGMSRFVPYLAELQPAMFVEVHPELAAERGLINGGWATIVSPRGAIEARVLVTDRMRPVDIDGRRTHQVGLPYHWGSRGLTTGGSANDLTAIVLDPNVHISEYKALTCDIRPGRRPRGADLPRFVAEVRDAALSARARAPRQEPEEHRRTEPPGQEPEARGDE